MIPFAREISGKLLLVEQHPLHSRRGVVIAIAPLAGLNVSPIADTFFSKCSLMLLNFKHNMCLNWLIQLTEPISEYAKCVNLNLLTCLVGNCCY